jgi:transposase-like protein
MPAPRKYPDELRERAVRMVLEIRARDGKGQGELARVGRQLGVHPEALRGWVKQAECGRHARHDRSHRHGHPLMQPSMTPPCRRARFPHAAGSGQEGATPFRLLSLMPGSCIACHLSPRPLHRPWCQVHLA